jgi:hypothetical protein
MHWEKTIHIRITWRRIVGTLLAASTVANLIIAGAVYGADSDPPVFTHTLLPMTSSLTDAVTVSTSASAPSQPLAGTYIPGVILSETPTVTSTDTPTQISTDISTWRLCIRKFYWPRYRVLYGDTLFGIAYVTGSTVQELMSANCLSTNRIYIGQVLFVPRGIGDALTSAPTATPTPTSTETPSATLTATQTLTATYTDTPSSTPTATPTSTDTPSVTPTVSPTLTYTPSLTGTISQTSTYTFTPTPTVPLRITLTVSPGTGTTTVVGPN